MSVQGVHDAYVFAVAAFVVLVTVTSARSVGAGEAVDLTGSWQMQNQSQSGGVGSEGTVTFEPMGSDRYRGVAVVTVHLYKGDEIRRYDVTALVSGQKVSVELAADDGYKATVTLKAKSPDRLEGNGYSSRGASFWATYVRSGMTTGR